MKTLALFAIATTPLLLAACHDDDYDHHHRHAYHGDRVYVEDHDRYRQRGVTYRTERDVVVEPRERRVYTTY